MLIKKLFLSFSIFILFASVISCASETLTSTEPKEDWNQVTPSSVHFSARSGHQAFLGDNGRLWVIGGWDGSFKNDIWYSDDNAKNWNQVSVANTHFSARQLHQAFLGNDNRLWVIGGTTNGSNALDDIWYSDDNGTNWNQVSAAGHFSARYIHQSFLGENGRLWVIGGTTDGNNRLNDIWYSDDNAKNWNQVSVANTHFSARAYYQAFLGEGGRLWVIGGNDSSFNVLDDIWYSDDKGTNWNQVNPSVGYFSARYSHQSFLGKDGKRLWVIGGTIYDGSRVNDIWYSDNEGVNWNQVSVANTHFSARQYHQAFLGENGRLWVIGGDDGSLKNDIWYSD